VWAALREEVEGTLHLGHVFVIGDLNSRTGGRVVRELMKAMEK